jgi:hypothetical protein
MAPPHVTTLEPPTIFLSFLPRGEVVGLLLLGLDEGQISEEEWHAAMERFAPTTVAIAAYSTTVPNLGPPMPPTANLSQFQTLDVSAP